MKKFFIIPMMLLSIVACNKKEVASLDFDVKAEKSSYNAGDTVKFLLSGNPDQVVFFSGESGHKYIYKDRNQAESDSITLEFATNRRYGADAQQPNSLRLFVSQKFNGQYSAENILQESEWTDITPAFTLSGIQSNDSYVASGVVNLTKLGSLGFTLNKAAPVYFAFCYMGNTGSTQPRWWINKFNLNTTTTDGQVLSVANISTSGWKMVKFGESPVNWVYGSDGTLKFQGGNAATKSNHVWAITSGLYLTSVQPDEGVALKNMSTRMDEYEYVFTEPGEYTVTFVASNENIYGASRSVKEATVMVE